MKKVVKRDTILTELEAVIPGLSTRDVIEQSSCFVFSQGEVITYNGEIACHHVTSLRKLEGAIQAKPLLNTLRLMSGMEVEIATKDGDLIIEGIGKKGQKIQRRAEIRMDSEIMLPVENIEHPKEWKPLHKNFLDAINLVHQCTGKDENKFWTTCVHLHPDYIEASDNDQISRYTLPTSVRRSVLVRGASIKHILTLGFTEFSETKTWIHFRNGEGLIFSCLRFKHKFPDLSPYLEVKGKKATFPKLKQAAKRAEVFSSENPESNRILVELQKDGRLRITGEGASGKYVEGKRIKYEGPAIAFLIAPNLLTELSSRFKGKCSIAANALKVNGGHFEYVASLGKPGDDEDEGQQEEEDEEEE